MIRDCNMKFGHGSLFVFACMFGSLFLPALQIYHISITFFLNEVCIALYIGY